MRLAFTICLNALHHFQHNNYVQKMLPCIDEWVFVEGVAGNRGSTWWCNPVTDKWHVNGHSIDGTLDYLDDLSHRNPNVSVISAGHDGWASKDAMCNAALSYLRDKHGHWMHTGEDLFLWQMDADEQWIPNQMNAAEDMLKNDHMSGTKAGRFLCDFWVGKDLLARGEWGEGLNNPQRRLWLWYGEMFNSHEPPQLNRQDTYIDMPFRFQHYAYYFPQDVLFKEEYYSGHEGVMKRWWDLQEERVFPQPISCLITGTWGESLTYIVKHKNISM